MHASILGLIQAGPRLSGATINALVVALMAGAVALVWWASRPSVIARYPSRPPGGDAAPTAEKEPRA